MNSAQATCWHSAACQRVSQAAQALLEGAQPSESMQWVLTLSFSSMTLRTRSSVTARSARRHQLLPLLCAAVEEARVDLHTAHQLSTEACLSAPPVSTTRDSTGLGKGCTAAYMRAQLPGSTGLRQNPGPSAGAQQHQSTLRNGPAVSIHWRTE